MKKWTLWTVWTAAVLGLVAACVSPSPVVPGSCAAVPKAARGTITHHGRTYLLNHHAPLHGRRFALFASETVASNLPPSCLTALPVLSPAWDQGPQGSCTANANDRILQFVMTRHLGQVSWMPSRAFTYATTRITEGTFPQDSGASGYDTIESLANTGEIPDAEMPYVATDCTTKPTNQQTADAAHTRAVAPVQIPTGNLSALKQWLAAGNTAAFGIQVYASFESDAVANSGEVPVPCAASEELLGGHDLFVAGYDDLHPTLDGATGAVLVCNSWGADWGCQPAGAVSRGFAWVPYGYVTNADLTSDCNGFADVTWP